MIIFMGSVGGAFLTSPLGEVGALLGAAGEGVVRGLALTLNPLQGRI
jgi:hypothetical protein